MLNVYVCLAGSISVYFLFLGDYFHSIIYFVKLVRVLRTDNATKNYTIFMFIYKHMIRRAEN